MHMSEVNQQSLGAMAYARDWTPDMVRAEMDALKHKPGALLPILHAVQNRIGYIPEGAVAIIALPPFPHSSGGQQGDSRVSRRGLSGHGWAHA